MNLGVHVRTNTGCMYSVHTHTASDQGVRGPLTPHPSCFCFTAQILSKCPATVQSALAPEEINSTAWALMRGLGQGPTEKPWQGHRPHLISKPEEKHSEAGQTQRLEPWWDSQDGGRPQKAAQGHRDTGTNIGGVLTCLRIGAESRSLPSLPILCSPESSK